MLSLESIRVRDRHIQNKMYNILIPRSAKYKNIKQKKEIEWQG